MWAAAFLFGFKISATVEFLATAGVSEIGNLSATDGILMAVKVSEKL